MQQWDCSLHGTVRNDNTVFSWPSCGGGCVQVEFTYLISHVAGKHYQNNAKLRR